MFVEYKSSPAKIQARIDELARATAQNLSVNDAYSDQFQTAFLHSVGPVSDIAGIQLSQDDYLIISIPRDLAENSPTRSPFVTVTERSIYSPNQDALQLKVASYLIKPTSLYTKGLIAFFIILATTLFCVTYLIYLYASEKKSYDSDFEYKKEESKDIKKDYIPGDYNQDEKAFSEIETDKDEAYLEPTIEEQIDNELDEIKAFDDEEENHDDVLEENEEPEAENSYESDYQMPQSPSSTITQEEFQALTQDLLDEPLTEDDTDENIFNDLQQEENRIDSLSEDEQELNDRVIKNESLIKSMIEEEENSEPSILPEMNPIQTKLDIKPDEPKKEVNTLSSTAETSVESVEEKENRPAGLFSPKTGFGWEEYMIPRLDSELIRAASGDQDLTVMTIEISKIDWNSDEAKEIRELIMELVKFRDLIFEYGESGCTAIIQNMGIEEALKAAEDLHTNIIASLAKRKLYYIVSIGLSSRSLRLISGHRIAEESEQALIHAMEDKSNPVVAFKVNTERYRNYIATESAKLDKIGTQLPVASS